MAATGFIANSTLDASASPVSVSYGHWGTGMTGKTGLPLRTTWLHPLKPLGLATSCGNELSTFRCGRCPQSYWIRTPPLQQAENAPWPWKILKITHQERL